MILLVINILVIIALWVFLILCIRIHRACDGKDIEYDVAVSFIGIMLTLLLSMPSIIGFAESNIVYEYNNALRAKAFLNEVSEVNEGNIRWVSESIKTIDEYNKGVENAKRGSLNPLVNVYYTSAAEKYDKIDYEIKF